MELQYRIKQIPEDFRVEELPAHRLLESQGATKGAFVYFRLRKRNYTTLAALQALAHWLGIPLKAFGFAGNKDRHAVTGQFCSARGGHHAKRLGLFRHQDIEVSVVGRGDIPLSLGELEGNCFEIVVRGLPPGRNYEEYFLTSKIQIPNYFDEQRFSTQNVPVGRALVKKEFAKACALIRESDNEFSGALTSHLQSFPQDVIGALQKLPQRILVLYIHAYQSYLFNELLSAHVLQHAPVVRAVHYSLGQFVFPLKRMEEIMLPVPGFGTELKDSPLARKMEELLMREGITLRDFIIREIPRLSAEGGLREGFVAAENFSCSAHVDDELNPGRKKTELRFSLPKGSYATMVVRQVMLESQG
ncbi:hypothetical protein COY95_01515 [Candidatus Woesearchaeota archaeon CG_4_10_14_0_8_um_filter_47_5]|nr:MAG: hypothetical protein COY95_01515 [Candidatus Woesearchaeota archaeon CG_4_10_14_0_8_um_filter_47_5]